MARILAYTSPARGHLFPLTPILDELHGRGHQVALRTLAAEVPFMRSRGFDAAPVDERIEKIEHDDWRYPSPRKGLAASVAVFAARAEHDAPDLQDAIAAERPDVLIVDVNSWGALAAAEEWGGPWAAFCPYSLPVSSRDVPPFGPGFPFAKSPLGRVRDRLLRPLVRGVLEKTYLPPLNRLRASRGLSQLSSSDELFLRPPLLLSMTAEPFEYPRSDWPENVLMIGPSAWEPPSDSPSWMAALDKPIVLVTTSSEFQDDGRLVRTALEALAHEPVHAVATLPAGDPASYTVPANANVERFVPHGPLLARAVCAITHGGMGATQKALAHGVPVCVVPFGRDQLEVARRVEAAGAGSRLPAKRLNADRLRKKVREAIARREGAKSVADAFARAGGAPAAANAIEAQLINSSHLRNA